MPRAHPQVHTFNAGELSPLLYGRQDLARYANGCRALENQIPTVQGPARRRGGTRFAGTTRIADQRTWLARFEFSRTQAYILEFSPLALRFFTSRAQLTSGGAVYEIATPYTAEDLTNADGAFGLRMVQSGDVLYIACAGKPAQTLSRLGAVSWVLAPFVTRYGPLQDQNSNKALRLFASARTGTVTIEASAALFTTAMIGHLIRLDIENIDIPPWEPNKAYTLNQLVRSDGKTYKSLNGDGTRVSGTKTPIHEEGTAFDGSGQTTDDPPKNIGIQWEYQDPGYGVARITGFTSNVLVTAAVQADAPLPAGVVGSGNPTNAWQIGAWGAATEYPAHVTFWNGRLVWAGRRRVWASVPREFDNYGRDIIGQVRDDAGLDLPIESPEANAITWMHATDVLLVGTEGSEFIIRKGTETEPLGPANVRSYEKSTYGSRAVRPVRVAQGVVIVQKSGRRVRELRYDDESGTYEAPDLTVLAPRLPKEGVVDWAWQQEPDRILWLVCGDGSLRGLTLDREQEVIGWHRHPTQGFVEAVQVIPSPDGSRDDVWLVVRRVLNGVTVRCVEYLDRGHEEGDAVSSCFFVDCGLSYSGAPATTIDGLEHLAGMQVDVLADGGTHPRRTVASDGTIVLTAPASVVHAGLPFRSVLSPMPIEAGASRGTSQGKTKRIPSVTARVFESLGLKVGPSLAKLSRPKTRDSSMPSGTAPPLFTGDVVIDDFDGNYGEDAPLYFVQDDPLPMTILALMPEVVTNERS